MAILVEVNKIEEKDDRITYEYCSNSVDWGRFSVNINNIEDILIIYLAENDPKRQYLLRAVSALNRCLNEEGVFPDNTYYAA